MPSGRISNPESGSYEAASSDYFGSLMVRKNGAQPARRHPYSHVDTSSEDSDDSQVFTTPSTSSYLSESPPMPSPFSPARSRGVAALKGRHPPPSSGEGPSTLADTRHSSTNRAETSTPTSAAPDDLDLYSIAGLPVLDTSLPASELPDDLIVHDAHDLPYPVRYVRVTPLAKGARLYAVPARDLSQSQSQSQSQAQAAPRRVAQLHLANDNHISEGHGHGHSAVFRAPLTLSVAAGSEVATRVRVVAKTPAPVCGSHRQLHHEARMYHAFPRELAEGSTQASDDASSPSSGVQKRKMSWREQLGRFGLRRTPRNSKSSQAGLEKRPTVTHTPEARTPAVDRPDALAHRGELEVALRPPRSQWQSGDMPPVAVVVPKFFGYYLLLKPDGEVFFELSEGHGECGEDGACAVAWPPAIVLIEDCGAPIQPSRFTDAQRWECYRLLDGLHSAGFVVGQPGQHARAASEWTGKMLVQPGPLGVPREARSYASPSFRLVDFGRARCRQAGFEEHWQEWCDADLDGAFDALQLDHRAS